MLTSSINVTPDGFCNHQDVIADDDFMNFAADLIEASDLLILGRKSYDLFAAHWPRAARDPATALAEARLARAINDKPRIVVSRSMSSADWPGTTILSDMTPDSARATVAGKAALSLGSPSILSQLAEWGVTDRLVFSVHPVLSGQGARLFDGHSLAPDGFRLAKHGTLPSGVSNLTFERNPMRSQ